MSKTIDLTAAPTRRDERSIARSLAFANDTSHRRHSPILRHVVPGRPLQVPAGALRRADAHAAARPAGARPSVVQLGAGRRAGARPLGAGPAVNRTSGGHTSGGRTMARPVRSGALAATASAGRPTTTTGTGTATTVTAAAASGATAGRTTTTVGRSTVTTGDVRLLTSGAAALAPARREQEVAEREQTLRVVPPPARRARRSRRSALLVLTVAAIAFLAVMMHASLAENQFRLDRVNNSIAGAERRNQALRLQVAELESPERVVREAERLGLSAPEQVTFLASKGGPVTATGTTASPTTASDASNMSGMPSSPTAAPVASSGAVDPSAVVSSMASPESTVPLAGGRVPRGQVR